KYGILSELTSPQRLVQANGLMESSTIAAILTGAIAGGVLAGWNVQGGVVIVAAYYAAAAFANLLIPPLPPAPALRQLSVTGVARVFGAAARELWRVADARFCILGTSAFWGAGATLRFLLVAWVPVALGVSTTTMPANFSGMVAVGIVIGAALAGRLVTLEKV